MIQYFTAQIIGSNGTLLMTSAIPVNNLWLDLNLSAIPTGGTPTLDVYLQTSVDGTFWRDIAHTQFTTSVLHRIMQINGHGQAGGNAPLAASDAQLSGETVNQGPFADQLRLKWVFAAGGSSGTYTLTPSLCLKA